LTLIPPSGEEFATTFAQDLTEVTGDEWTVEVVETLPDGPGIGLTQYTGNDTKLSYENETPTEEGYELDVKDGKITISGTGSRGVWWGTRTVLQYLYLSNFTSVPAMKAADTPAYATRGYMLDAGRKWYSPSFLKELCTFASFFKLSEFHYHVSDNYPLNRGHNETWQDVYSQFSLRPEDPELFDGLIERVNETLTREDYADLESHCAARGIAVIPEIEAPGHCLTITKWKPELALEKKDLLNLSHPDSIPTVQRIWDEFLPWFNVKEVHIGADEYNASLADVYIHFVNGMAAHINSTTGKAVRAWGTPFDPPTDPTLHLDPAVTIQHWQYGQSDPLQLQADGHPIINSEDWWAYVSIKNDHMPILPARYPQALNTSRILNFGDEDGRQWSPDLFNPFNTSAEYQLAPTSANNKGAIMASWNDNGPDASTQLEAYYAWRLGLPLVAARAWSGARGPKVDASSVDASLDFLAARAPAQNLDRRIVPLSSPSTSGPLFTWTSSSGPLNAGSAGVNHTLTLHARGPFTLSTGDATHGNETTLQLTDSGALIYTADGWPYPLRSVAEGDGFDPGAPGRIWVNASASSHEEVSVPLPQPQGNGTQEGDEIEIEIETTVDGGSRVWIDGQWAGRFEVFVFGGKNTLFSWSQMAFVAPLDGVQGGLVGLEVWEGERGCDGEGGSGS
ncbi:MAG: family 20 glycosylhydrolase, partial [Terriglobus roseus]|nr:family 20 glycosylhydrolase [Terriglobus roseus]